MTIDKMIYRRSAKGVPHILITTGGKTYSVCYFGKTQELKVWDYLNQEKLGNFPMGEKDEINLLEIIKQT